MAHLERLWGSIIFVNPGPRPVVQGIVHSKRVSRLPVRLRGREGFPGSGLLFQVAEHRDHVGGLGPLAVVRVDEREADDPFTVDDVGDAKREFA